MAKTKSGRKKPNEGPSSSSSSCGTGGRGRGAAVSIANANGESLLAVDPARIRFQHSKVRPFFSGCGRAISDTLEQIRDGRLAPSDLPPIQVLVGPSPGETNGGRRGGGDDDDDDDDDAGPWYFSLNNRRLWVLKRCREEGLLEATDNKIWVRVRPPKSQQERERYTVANCALEAKVLVERAPDPVATVPTTGAGRGGGPRRNDRARDTLPTNEGSKGRPSAGRGLEGADEPTHATSTASLATGADDGATRLPRDRRLPPMSAGSVPSSGERYDVSVSESDSDDDDVFAPSNRFSSLY